MENTVPDASVALTEVEMEGEVFYKISNVGAMRPFFMSIVSDSNHWLFAASNGGISAGRKNADFALFPYYTDDKIVENAETTGCKTIVRLTVDGKVSVWEPFSVRSEGMYHITRNLYKNRYGNKLIFEEINETLQVAFRYGWYSSNQYGFVRRACLTNLSNQNVQATFVDGLQNLLPYGVGADLQTNTSNLADAYKRSELVPQTGLGIFALSAIIVDKAEPSEALKANVAWQTGLQNPSVLLSLLQLEAFRRGQPIVQETDIKGERGCYLLHTTLSLAPSEARKWTIVANVNQTHAAIALLNKLIVSDASLDEKIEADIQEGTQQLLQMIASADGLQHTADGLRDTRHFANVLFNIMRGGIFDNNYMIEKWDFERYLQKANAGLAKNMQPLLQGIAPQFSVMQLKQLADNSGNVDFERLATEYLPLKFSRRHGDPSRPWNQFSINIRNEVDGSKILDYQGNWRDIFQNWEALAVSFPGFLEGMVYKFLNASTFDGYNPYRVTKDGFDWETIEPDNPWSYIGYWGDHQIIYLLKFFEWQHRHAPNELGSWLHKKGFVYAHVPYRIKGYNDILNNPKDTITFDHQAEHAVRERMAKIGADGSLLTNASGALLHVTFAEKILATVLSKLTNLVPGGGIWMNTQRPEWNDANNALVGNGLSMVTLCYLRRFLSFFIPLLKEQNSVEIELTQEMASLFETVKAVMHQYEPDAGKTLSPATRKAVMDALGTAGSRFREQVYNNGFSGNTTTLPVQDLVDCFTDANTILEQAIKTNERPDALYHTYNIISYSATEATVGHLSEMLEGQVAVLSSGFLSASQCVAVLDALRHSALYRKDQYSYILYPNKQLPGFLQKNKIPVAFADGSKLLQELLAQGDFAIGEKDINGEYYFNGNFRNAADLKAGLAALDSRYSAVAQAESDSWLNVFEEVFNHKEFTGRSGTFYGYEGLGSIYWHMVSKLLLAVQENCLKALHSNEAETVTDKLVAHYYAINEGIGVHKPVNLYGAFTTDPYSHTPMGKGAQQPGMTGQVKEDILCRIGELGIWIDDGKVQFNPLMLRRQEFTTTESKVWHPTVQGNSATMTLPARSVFFTYCQVPVVYSLQQTGGIVVTFANGEEVSSPSNELSSTQSHAIWNRTGEIAAIRVMLEQSKIRY
ncbi:MAG: hypothetical protein EAY75_16735 [Bacteroidetes bacterium]|nr:MAG: hypothetical protein EAY75_16735 [Bacteroidota bacterium]